MKTTKLKNLCLTFLICVFVINALTHTLVHAAQTIPGVQRLAEGIAAYEHGEYDDAIFKLEMAVYQIPEEEKDQLWKAHLYLGLSYHLTGDNDEARNQFIKAQGIIKNKLPGSDINSPKIVRLFKEAQLSQTGNIRRDPISGILTTKFKSTSRENLSTESVKTMLKDKGFYDRSMNHSASGFRNDYILQNGGMVVYDRTSSLMWQQSGSDKSMRYKNAKAYVTRLNCARFAGYNDWRLPTLEEAMTLMEPSKKNGDLYVDSVFNKTQVWIWMSDLYSASRAWVINFGNGGCGNSIFYYGYYVRAVR
jgi:tetratricopeptide (TPR) repeat protein